MAKQIKAIKCPQCGSTQNIELKPDFFRCSNCGTEYYLDNDDININYTYKNQPPQPAFPVKPTKKTAFVILAFFFSLLIVVFVIGMVSQPGNTYTGAATAGTIKQTDEIINYSTWQSAKMLFVRDNGEQPVIVYLSQRSYYSSPANNGFYLSFLDVKKHKEISNRLLQKTADDSPSTDVSVRTFSNGDLYFIINKTKIYRIDKNNLSATDVSTSLFATQPELQVGVATAEFVYSNYGSGLTLLTNDGKTYTYYPLVNKLYNKDEVDKVQNGFASLLPNATEKTYFTFTRSGFDYPDEKLQLLKIIYKDNNGGPKNILTEPSWTKDFGGSGIFTDADPYRKVLISKEMMAVYRISSFTDLTPGRLYFGPDVLYSNGDNLLITVRANAAPDAPLNLQSIDVNTGAVKWTTKLSNINPDQAVATTDGFVITDYQTAAIINKNGTLVNQFKLD